MTDRPDDRPSGEEQAPEPAAPPRAPAPKRHPFTGIPWSDHFLWPGERSGDATDAGGNRVSSTLRLVLIATLMLVLWVLVWDSRPPPQDDLSPDVLGRWHTATAPFADRFFWLSRESVAFDQGGGHLASYPIRQVVRSRVGDVDRYGLVYQAEGGDAELTLEHDAAAGTLRMTSRPGVVWRR